MVLSPSLAFLALSDDDRLGDVATAIVLRGSPIGDTIRSKTVRLCSRSSDHHSASGVEPIKVKVVIRVVAFVAFVLLSPSAALAIINPCSLTGVMGFSPYHPLPSDEIHFAVGLYELNNVYPPYSGPPRMVIRKVVVGSENQIAVDVIVTTDGTPFPDYEVDTVVGAFTSAEGRIGSLSVGGYTVTSSLRQYDVATRALVPVCELTRTSLLTVYATPPVTAPVVEFYHSGLDHYFLTQDVNEIRDLDTGVKSGWVRTGKSFRAYLPGETNGHVPPAYRFYGLPSAGLDSHVYTQGGTAEAFNLLVGPVGAAWKLETYDAFEINYPNYADGSCPIGTIPVYRLWNQRVDSNHRYTTDPTIKAEMIARGYVPEGYGNDAVFFCALADN